MSEDPDRALVTAGSGVLESQPLIVVELFLLFPTCIVRNYAPKCCSVVFLVLDFCIEILYVFVLQEKKTPLHINIDGTC